jgi:hypothetical protein
MQLAGHHPELRGGLLDRLSLVNGLVPTQVCLAAIL